MEEPKGEIATGSFAEQGEALNGALDRLIRATIDPLRASPRLPGGLLRFLAAESEADKRAAFQQMDFVDIQLLHNASAVGLMLAAQVGGRRMGRG